MGFFSLTFCLLSNIFCQVICTQGWRYLSDRFFWVMYITLYISKGWEEALQILFGAYLNLRIPKIQRSYRCCLQRVLSEIGWANDCLFSCIWNQDLYHFEYKILFVFKYFFNFVSFSKRKWQEHKKY